MRGKYRIVEDPEPASWAGPGAAVAVLLVFILLAACGS